MVESAAGLSRIVARYREELARMGIRVTSVLVFGSYARGAAREDSDTDLIVVSDDFTRLNGRERLEVLGVAAAKLGEPIQAYGVTRDEVEERALSPFWSGIVEHEAVPMS
ncbi:MAG: nucleotidyltransferase domain-containing protein [Chloroflexi bacterium]|nr:nucleotidyltransferase domain-containing protein [Chloroflexota bacterium]